MGKSYWKVRSGVYSGFTKTGKRFMGKMTAEQARKKAGLTSKSRSRSNPRRKSKTRRSNPRRRGKSGGGRVGKSLSTSLMKLARAGALVGPAAFTLAEKGVNANGFKWVVLRYTGVDSSGKFHGSKLLEGWGPFVAVSAVTYLIPKINGLIRRI